MSKFGDLEIGDCRFAAMQCALCGVCVACFLGAVLVSNIPEDVFGTGELGCFSVPDAPDSRP